MILKKERIKKVKGTRTYRFRITNPDDIDVKFPHVQEVQAHYFNYALKYMYQHYGVKHLEKLSNSLCKYIFLVDRFFNLLFNQSRILRYPEPDQILYESC